MADRDEKIFPALPQKRQRAREQGQIARSRDLTSAIGFGGVAVLGPALFTLAGRYSLLAFANALSTGGAQGPGAELTRACYWPLVVVVVIGGSIAVIATIGAAAQGGLVFAPQLSFNFSRLSPLGYFKRIFSAAGGIELLKATLKISAVVLVAWRIAKATLLITITQPTVWAQLATLAGAVRQFLWISAAIGLVAAAADYGYKLYQHESDLRMTRQEFLDELKQEQGNPQVKRALKTARRRNFKRQRGIHQAATASVVLTNPTHFAVALRYRRGFDQAPLVVAKGAGDNALRVIAIARLAAVPVVQNKLLARTLFRSVEVGDHIPRPLYRAVAEVLATIMRAEARRRRNLVETA